MKALICYGTRPEKIKLAPVRAALEARGVDVREFMTVQSPDLLDGEDATAGVTWHSLIGGIASVLTVWRLSVASQRPDVVIVQGDTATAFSCALAGFLEDIPVAHVEAGLRTYAKEPWPEEGFRRMIAAMATWHFSPDLNAAECLLQEMNVDAFGEVGQGWKPFVDRGIYVTGNTLIDSLPQQPLGVLVTLHRRENWGERIQRALNSLATLAHDVPQLQIGVVRHPNWDAQAIEPPPAADGLMYADPIKDHDTFIEALRAADLIVTDSGGLQEEAAHFGIPCIVYRSATERVALERSGAVRVVHPDESGALREAIEHWLGQRRAYGWGDAGEKIADILVKELEDG